MDMLFLCNAFVFLALSHFGFEDMIMILFAPVPCCCLLSTFIV